jgi:DNA-binding NarL/FixJ family response regulator
MMEKGRHRHGMNGRGYKGVLNGASKLTEEEVKDILLFHRDGLSIREIAEHFEVSESTIRMIVKGQTWKHILRMEAQSD